MIEKRLSFFTKECLNYMFMYYNKTRHYYIEAAMGCGSSVVFNLPENERNCNEDDNEDPNGNEKKVDVSKSREMGNGRSKTGTHAMVAGDGPTIHVPSSNSNDEIELDIEQRSPNTIKLEKEREQDDKAKMETEKRQQEVDQKGQKKLDETGLKKMVDYIKKSYSDTSLDMIELQRAAAYIGIHVGKPPSNYNTSVVPQYHEKKLALHRCRQEKSRYLHKLSELASNQLRHNNANIADLSDPNRANKISERFSELYDNEWTDVYEAIRLKDKKKTVTDAALATSLLNILKYCFHKSQELSDVQRKLLYKTLHIPEDNTSIHLKLYILDLRKVTVELSKPVFVKTIQNGAIENFKQHSVLKLLYPLKSPNPYQKYIDLCSELCWYMHIQSPPCDLDFEAEARLLTAFRPYLQSGETLEYVVWPALLLHQNGPLLSKGVAQFQKSSDVKDKKTDNTDTENASKETDLHENKTVW